MEIETRFPMFGGWQTQFYIGYSIPTGDTFSLCLLLLLLFLRLLWLCYWGLDNTCFEFDFLSFPVVVVFCYSVTLDFFSFPIPFLLLSIPFLLAIPFSSFSVLLFSLSTLLAWWFTPSFFSHYCSSKYALFKEILLFSNLCSYDIFSYLYLVIILFKITITKS